MVTPDPSFLYFHGQKQHREGQGNLESDPDPAGYVCEQSPCHVTSVMTHQPGAALSRSSASLTNSPSRMGSLLFSFK